MAANRILSSPGKSSSGNGRIRHLHAFAIRIQKEHNMFITNFEAKV